MSNNDKPTYCFDCPNGDYHYDGETWPPNNDPDWTCPNCGTSWREFIPCQK